MIKYFTFFTLLFFVPFLCLAQSKTEIEELLWTYFDKAIDITYTDRDSTYFYFKEAEKLATHLNLAEEQLFILTNALNASDYHFDLKMSAIFLNEIDSLLSLNKNHLLGEDYDAYLAVYRAYQGNYLYKLGSYERAKEYFLKIESEFNSKSDTELDDIQADALFRNNNFLSVIYKRTGKYELSEQYLLSNRALINQNQHLKQFENAYITNVDQLLGQLYTELQHYEKANTIFEKNLKTYKQFYTRDTKFKNNLVNSYQHLTENNIAQNNLEMALAYLNESPDYLLPEDPFYKRSLLFYGDIYMKLGDNLKALDYYKKALVIYQEYRQNKPHQDIAEVYGKIAALHLVQGNYSNGLEKIQDGLCSAGNDIQLLKIEDDPDPKNVFSRTQLLHLLEIKLQLLQSSYEKTGSIAFQNAALQTGRAILTTFDVLKSEFDSKLDKQFLAEKAYPIFHRLLETAHNAYEKNPSPKTIQLALNIAEKNKDFVLLEALRNAQATQYGNVPNDILEKEAQLRAAITNVEKQLFDANETESGYSEALFDLKQEYYAFLETIKINYPKYHELKYQNRTLNLTTIRKKVLDDDGTLISYTMADNYLYAIVINDSKSEFQKLPFTLTDREKIRNFYRLLSSSTVNDTEKEISDIATYLFNTILKEPLAEYNSENLTIIPDGELHYLPFDLLQENGTYILQSKNIGYGNSVTSLLELKEKNKGQKNKMLAFAPSFSGVATPNAERQFGKLLYNDDEVQKIGLFYDAEMLFQKEATLANFRSKASQFNIFHLATHASANDEYPDYSYLAFTETNDSTASNILYIKDLYNITLNADMVTLSACQTGIGKLQKGQGMLSLSKGFYYAGAKSLVTTLWKINDKSTVKLMEYFYESLNDGYSKSEALRNAKLKYLKNTDDELLKHPYYWAAFVVSGDVSAITQTHFWWYVALGFIVLAALVFFLGKKKGRLGG